jgi:hypothetical protein
MPPSTKIERVAAGRLDRPAGDGSAIVDEIARTEK